MIRPATAGDEAAILAIRNHAEVLRWSEALRPVSPEVHHAWFVRALAHPARHTILVAVEDEGALVGYARYFVKKTATVSVAVAPEVQRRGYGEQLLIGLTGAAWEQGLQELVARVQGSNVASQRLFTRTGYTVLPRDGYDEFRVWV